MPDEAKQNRWGADPEKYKLLAVPFKDRAEADRATSAFIDEVARLREKYHIAELCVQLQVYIRTETPEGDGVETLVGGAGWGDQMRQARLAKMMADREIDAALNMMGTMAASVDTIAAQLITDPRSYKK
jgi:hypothetical protein